MIVSISQPRYLPWIGYFHRISLSDIFIYLDTVQYTPRDWENRNRVMCNGKWVWLTVPVNARYKTKLPDVTIDNSVSWSKKHWMTIESLYSKSRYYNRYAPSLKKVYSEGQWGKLVDLNISLTDIQCAWLLSKKVKILRASELGVQGMGSELILNICKAVDATVYLPGSQGRNYLNEVEFRSSGIDVQYHDYESLDLEYYNCQTEKHLPALDLLFNHGPQSLSLLMK